MVVATAASLWNCACDAEQGERGDLGQQDDPGIVGDHRGDCVGTMGFLKNARGSADRGSMNALARRKPHHPLVGLTNHARPLKPGELLTLNGTPCHRMALRN